MVTKEVAIADINAWLDAKKVSAKKREAQADYIELLVSEVEEGRLSFDSETNELVYDLKWPLENDGQTVVETLKFKYRINSNHLSPYLQKVKPSDADGRLRAYICALTSSNSGYINKLDTEDLTVAQAIAVFFL